MIRWNIFGSQQSILKEFIKDDSNCLGSDIDLAIFKTLLI